MYISRTDAARDTRPSAFLRLRSDDEGEELFYKRGTEFKLPYPCLYDFDTNFNSAGNDDETYSLKHHSTLIKSGNGNPSVAAPNAARPVKKVSKSNSSKQQALHPFTSNSSSTSSSSFDPYYNAYPSTYVPPYGPDVTAASFIEAATNNYANNAGNANELLLVNEANAYTGTYSNYYAAALQQQYQNSLTPYHAVYYQDANNRYYPNHRSSPSAINEANYHQHHAQQQQQQQAAAHENYLLDGNNANNPYSYYLYNKTPSMAGHGHDSNNNLSLFDVALPTPIHHSVIKHSTKR